MQPQGSTHCQTRRILPGLCALALLLNLWGMRRDLPYIHDYDEQPFVMPAYAMAVTGGWDPHWFGHPGSTVIYPLRMIYACWIAYAHGGDDFVRAVASIDAAFQRHWWEYFYIGRLLSIAYLVASVPVLYSLSRRLFGERTALWGSLLWIVMPLVVAWAQITRSDTAILFFGALCIDLLSRHFEHPSRKLRLWICVVLACAVSSHYKMACLGPLWLWTEWRIFQRGKSQTQFREVGLGCAAGALTFLALNPFLLFHLDALKRNLASQTPLQHPGADGLSPGGNLAWYLLEGLPGNFGWIAYALALAGIVLVLSRGSYPQKLLPGFVALYLFGIIWSPLHWGRWLSVVLPVLSILAVHALFALTDRQRHSRLLRAAGLALLLLPPLTALIFQNIRNSSDNTRIQALQWMQAHAPRGSQVAYEWYSAPLQRQPFKSTEVHALPARGNLQFYRDSKFEYLVVSSNMYQRFFDAPKRYASEVAFYQDLFAHEKLVASFVPSMTTGGSEIRIYKIAN
jgi:hypothetical protein